MNVITFEKLNFKQTYDLSQKLLKKGIETRRIWRPLNLQKHLSKFQTYKIINAQKIYESSLCLPSDDSLSIKLILIKFQIILKNLKNYK